VIANVEGEGHDAAEAVEVLFRDGPFLAPVLLDDVADMGDEDDVLLLLVGQDPLDLGGKVVIGHGRVGGEGTFAAAAGVMLRVGNDDEGEGARGQGRELAFSGDGRLALLGGKGGGHEEDE